MKTTIRFIFLPLVLIATQLLPGCVASSHKFATIGDVDFYTVKSPSLLGPSINMVVTLRSNEMSPVIQGQAAGNGAVNAAVSAAGIVGAAAVLRPAEINNNSPAITGVPADPEPPPPIFGPQLPTTIGNDKNTHPFTHRK